MADPTPAEIEATKKKAADDKKTAEAAEKQMLEDQKTAAAELAKTPVVVSGRAGGAFSIEGPGLGSSGHLTIGGRPISTTRWDDRSIRGVLPPAVKGAVVLTTDSGVRHGTFPAPVVVITKTTTVETSTAPVK